MPVIPLMFSNPCDDMPEIPLTFSNPCDDMPVIPLTFSNPCDDMPVIPLTFSNPCDDVPGIALTFSNPCDYLPGIALTFSNPCDDVPAIALAFSNLCDDMPAIPLAFLFHRFDLYIIINKHFLTIGHKNPEYTINGKLGDRKGIESENGIKSAFRKAKEQGCKTVVLDFDMHMAESVLKTRKIISGLWGRYRDFNSGIIEDCYIVHKSRAVVITSKTYSTSDKETIKLLISEIIEKLRT